MPLSFTGFSEVAIVMMVVFLIVVQMVGKRIRPKD
jgi:hypothetical protein